jgi:hypothetical protein
LVGECTKTLLALTENISDSLANTQVHSTCAYGILLFMILRVTASQCLNGHSSCIAAELLRRPNRIHFVFFVCSVRRWQQQEAPHVSHPF